MIAAVQLREGETWSSLKVNLPFCCCWFGFGFVLSCVKLIGGKCKPAVTLEMEQMEVNVLRAVANWSRHPFHNICNIFQMLREYRRRGLHHLQIS